MQEYIFLDKAADERKFCFQEGGGAWVGEMEFKAQGTALEKGILLCYFSIRILFVFAHGICITKNLYFVIFTFLEVSYRPILIQMCINILCSVCLEV